LFADGDQRLRPPLLLLPDEVLPEDLLPEDRVELLLVLVLPLDPDELLCFLTPLSREELLFVLLLLEPVLLFPESFVDRADFPERVEVFLCEDLLRLLPVSLAFVSLLELRARTRFSSSEPVFFRVVPRRFVFLVESRSKLLLPLSIFRVPPLSTLRVLVRVEVLLFWFVDLALRVVP